MAEIATLVQDIVGEVTIETTPSDDHRSYHICSDKIRRELGFEPCHDIARAAEDLVQAFRSGKVPNAMTDSRYYNVELMKQLSLS